MAAHDRGNSFRLCWNLKLKMTQNFLHHHPDFPGLIRIISAEMSISPVLVEKDYWIMQCLYGLQALGLNFQLKGGTSLSKGYGLIQRFSEDVDALIEPPQGMHVFTGRNQDKKIHRDSRRNYYDWLAANIQIDGIQSVDRDQEFDDEKYRSGGIRLFYQQTEPSPPDLKSGILLEVGFDDVTPNETKTISSWAYDYGSSKVDVLDNRAKNVHCYHPGYTLVEKLQTISTKFRKQQESGRFSENFMRHYYDVYCLLQSPEIKNFIRTQEYTAHKNKRFRADDNKTLSTNEAFVFRNPETRQMYEWHYESSKTLYYREKPTFDEILKQIKTFIDLL